MKNGIKIDDEDSKIINYIDEKEFATPFRLAKAFDGIRKNLSTDEKKKITSTKEMFFKERLRRLKEHGVLDSRKTKNDMGKDTTQYFLSDRVYVGSASVEATERKDMSVIIPKALMIRRGRFVTLFALDTK